MQHALTLEQLLGVVDHMEQYGTLTLVLGTTGIRFGKVPLCAGRTSRTTGSL